jgi:exonuclease III
MITYWIGYIFIDNYYYFINYKLNLEQTNNIKLFLDNFLFQGDIINNKFSGISTIMQNNKKLSSGYFELNKVSSNNYNKLKKYKSCWLYLLNNNYKNKIYNPIVNLSKYYRFSVMSFNICSAFHWIGDSGIKQVSDIIKYYNTDVIFFQEINNETLMTLSKYLKNKYYISLEHHILSKFPIIKTYKRPIYSPVYGVQIKINNTKIRLFNSHLDHQYYYNLEKSKYYQLAHLKLGLNYQDHSLPAILAGDHNIVSHLDETKLWPVSKYLYKNGWIDSYRSVNPNINKKIDYTYPNCNTRKIIINQEIGANKCILPNTKYKHRIDYIYSKNGKKNNLIPITSSIIHEFNNSWPSDHSAVLTNYLLI